LPNFCFFVFYEDESEQSECVAKHEKGYFVIKKSLKHCLFYSATVHVTASWCVFARKICCLQTRYDSHGNAITWYHCTHQQPIRDGESRCSIN